MLKRTPSWNTGIQRTPSETLSRSRSFHTLPPDNTNSFNDYIPKRISSLNVFTPRKLVKSKSFNSLYPDNLNFPPHRSIDRYVPVIKKVDLQEARKIVDKIYNSIEEDGWFSHIEDIDNDRQHLEKKANKTPQDLWNLRCCITKSMLIHTKNVIKESNEKFGVNKNDAYFVLYINRTPIGIMTLIYYAETPPYYPEVSLIITHPGISNCASLLIEKAVNISYEMGFHGKLKIITESSELPSKVYNRLGFINGNNRGEMLLNPNENKFWAFYPSHDGYQFISHY
ncbi:N-acetyltransferase [Xenorhabdus beddingii]|uniref:N-acetyltransferase n=1 Tax=Xenorhabdus beddingii TaxID=40578 RepID=A0A1Y2SK10_9GAMM|nr:GNAT family N-acetyltransferase [Xenorhabdus beddingii]OTA19041.1 N-acetyltransferase [Xenorhabdus beddingii]